MTRTEDRKIIEALLFAGSDPLTQAQVNLVFETTPPKLDEIMEELSQDYEANDHAYFILKVSNGYQLASKPEYEVYIRRLIHKSGRLVLTSAALETLAIVAYRQPVNRYEVESIRGVDCSGVLKTLLSKNLIKIKGRDAGPGRPILYSTTDKYLEHFGLKSLSEMPKISEISDLTDSNQAQTPQVDAFK